MHFDRWKVNAFDKSDDLLLAKKARIIDKLVFATMSGEKKALLRWMRFMFNQRMVEHGDKVKAGHILMHAIRREKAFYDLQGLAYA